MNTPIKLDPVLSCDSFIKLKRVKLGSYARDTYEVKLLNFDPVRVVKGEDYYRLSQHEQAFNAVLNELGGQA